MKFDFVPNKAHKSKIVWTAAAMSVIQIALSMHLVDSEMVNQTLSIAQGLLPAIIIIFRWKFTISDEAVEALTELSKKRY